MPPDKRKGPGGEPEAPENRWAATTTTILLTRLDSGEQRPAWLPADARWSPEDVAVYLAARRAFGLPECPPQHPQRLSAAGVNPVCPRHGCPLCQVDPVTGGEYCCDCELRAVRVAEAEGPADDPWCIFHGVPSEAGRRSCSECDRKIGQAKLAGWAGPTGHEGPDCAHCWVCGLCKGTGRVCRVCFQCPDHYDAERAADCISGAVWDRVLRVEVPYYAHQLWNPVARRWAA